MGRLRTRTSESSQQLQLYLWAGYELEHLKVRNNCSYIEGPVAQLARALHLQCRGREFESPSVHPSARLTLARWAGKDNEF